MARYFMDRDAITAKFIQHENRRQSVQARVRKVTPGAARLMNYMHRVYPGTPPGITRPLAQGNLSPDDRAARFVIKANWARNDAETGTFHGRTGTPQRAPRSLIGQIFDATHQYQAAQAAQENHDTFMAIQPFRTQLSPNQMVKAGRVWGILDDETGQLIRPRAEDGPGPQRHFDNLVNLVNQNGMDRVPYFNQDEGKFYQFDARSGIDSLIDPTTLEPLLSGEEMDMGMTLNTFRNTPDGQRIAELVTSLREDSERATDDELANAQLYQANVIEGSVNPLKTLSTVSDAMPGPQTFVRPTFMAFDAPVQELQGLVRNIYGELTGEDVDWLNLQSDLAISLPRLIRGEDVDLGTGFFVDPESAVAQERRMREAQRGQIGRHNVTAGRIIADTVTEPDTTPFRVMSGLVDLGMQVADPTAYALGKAGKVGTALRTFEAEQEAAGAFRGIRNFVHGPTAEAWIGRNTAVVDRLAEAEDAYAVGRATNFQLGPDLDRALGEASTSAEVTDILVDNIRRGQIRRTTDLKPTLTGRAASGMQTSFRNLAETLNPRYDGRPVRVAHEMPVRIINMDDRARTADTLRNAIINAHGDESQIRSMYNRIAGASDRQGVRDVIQDVFGNTTNGLLRQYGIHNEDVLDDLTRLTFSTEHERSYLRQVIGSDTPVWDDMIVNGEPFQLVDPHDGWQDISQFAHLPDPRAIRRLTSNYSWVTSSASSDLIPIVRTARRMAGRPLKTPTGQMRMPIAFADGMMEKFLKPIWLMRLAWPLRVVGEEQIRMSQVGLDSAFSGHPLSWLSIVIGNRDQKLARVLDTLTPGMRPRLDIAPDLTPMGQLDELQQVVQRAHVGWVDQPNTIASHQQRVYTRGTIGEERRFSNAWASELADYHNDPVANFVLNHTEDEAVDWLMAGEGKQYRMQHAKARPGVMLDSDSVRNYVQRISRNFQQLAGGDTGIIDAVRTGRFGAGNRVMDNDIRISQGFRDFVHGRTDNAPMRMVGPAQSSPSGLERARPTDRFVDGAMYALMGAPTGVLSRSPTFKQLLWQHTADLLPFADDVATRAVLEAAGEARVTRRMMRNLERRGHSADGPMSLEEVMDLAKANALDGTTDLLYDLSRRHQWSDITRLIFPFGEAWTEVLGTWGKLMIRKGGRPARRLQQLVQGARGEDLGAILGAPEGEGFFHQNQYGEEVFTYPGSQYLTNSLLGAPVPLSGRVQGLNMFGTIMPGLGPAAQIPVAMYLQDKPNAKAWRDLLLPFGGPGAEETGDIFELRDYLPAWAKTLVDVISEGGKDDRIYASSVMYADAYLASTGNYDNTPGAQQQRLEDARELAKNVYLTRMLGQFMLPSSPAPEWLINTETEGLTSQRILSEEFWKNVEDMGYQGATEDYLGKYGEEAVGAIIPHSRSVIFGVPTSREGEAWVLGNSGVREDFPKTYGFFAPQGEFDIGVYTRQFLRDERDSITPQQWQYIRDTFMGNYWYNRTKNDMGVGNNPTDQQAEDLDAAEEAIKQDYPYWGDETGMDTRPTTEHMIEELYRAIEDPRLANTDVGTALTYYLGARDQAQAEAESRGFESFMRSADTQDLREFLRGGVDQLIEQYPGFQDVYDMVLSRELNQGPEDE